MNSEIINAARAELRRQHEAIGRALEALDEAQDGVTVARGSVREEPEAAPVKRVPMGKKINRAATMGGGHSNSALAASVPALRGLKEPFRAGDVETACKVDKKKASNLLVRLKAKGWVACVAHGEYQRTKTFGGHAAKMDLLAGIHGEIAAGKPKED